MGTLTDEIRRLTGVKVADVSDPDVQAALDANRTWETMLPVDLETNVTLVAKRGTVNAWGLLQPDTSSSPAYTDLTDGEGVAPSGTWTLDADGTIVFSADQSLAGTLFLSAYSYDINAAAVQVIDQVLGDRSGDYDVKLGDQTFSRSQAVAGLERLRSRFAGMQLVTVVQRGRVDEVTTVSRRIPRRYQ